MAALKQKLTNGNVADLLWNVVREQSVILPDLDMQVLRIAARNLNDILVCEINVHLQSPQQGASKNHFSQQRDGVRRPFLQLYGQLLRVANHCLR